MSESTPEVVMVTGASGGVGRAIAHAFARRGAAVGLLARGEEGLEGCRAEVESLGGHALVLPSRRLARRRGRVRRRRARGAVRPHRRLGQRRHGHRLRPVRGDHRRGVHARHAGDLPRRRVRDHGGAEAHGAARPRHGGAGGLGAGVPGDPAAVGVLRLEVRHPRLHRLRAHRAHARQESCVDHHGPAARGQHPAVQLVPQQAAQPPAAGAAHLPARGARRGRVLRGPPSPPRGHLRSAGAHGHPWQQGPARARRPLPGAHRVQVPADPRHARLAGSP